MPETTFEFIVAICAGIGLAAAAGIRAFLPLLAVCIASRIGVIELNPGLDFLQSNVALVALVLATILEVAADKVPVLDNFLDVGATFLRPVSGFIAAMAMFGELPSSVAVAMALFAAAISLGTQLGRAKARLGSTATTGGLANPLLSTAEDAISGTLSVLAIVLPLLAAVLVIFFLYLLWRFVRGIRRAAGRAAQHVTGGTYRNPGVGSGGGDVGANFRSRRAGPRDPSMELRPDFSSDGEQEAPRDTRS